MMQSNEDMVAMDKAARGDSEGMRGLFYARGPAVAVIKSIRVQRKRSSDWHYSRPVVMIVLIVVCRWHRCSGGRGCQRPVETGLNRSCGGSPTRRISVNRNRSVSEAHRTATAGLVATGCSPVRLRFFPAHTTGLLNTSRDGWHKGETERNASKALGDDRDAVRTEG